MSLIDTKFEDAAKMLTDADDEVLQAAGMMALMRLETLKNRLKGIYSGRSPLTALPSDTSSPSQDDRKGESPATKARIPGATSLPQTPGGFPFGSEQQQLGKISGQDLTFGQPLTQTTVPPQTTLGVGLLTGQGLSQTSTPSTMFRDPKINTSTYQSTGSVLAATAPTNKAPPVNVPITASDPLFSIKTTTSQARPILSPQHLRGNVPKSQSHNYQIPQPSSTVPNIPPSILSKPPPAASTQSILSNVAPPVYSAVSEKTHSNVSFEKSLEQTFNGSKNEPLNKTNVSSSSIEESDPCPDYKPIIPLPDEVPVNTAEESEIVLFSERAKLYRFVTESKEWKERGVGILKILKNPESNRVRILMRSDQVLKICVNHFLTRNLTLTPTPNSDRAYVWAAHDYADEKVVLGKLCVRFGTAEEAKKFHDAFEKARKSLEDAPVNTTKSPETVASFGDFFFSSPLIIKPKQDLVTTTFIQTETPKSSPFSMFTFGSSGNSTSSFPNFQFNFTPVQKQSKTTPNKTEEETEKNKSKSNIETENKTLNKSNELVSSTTSKATGGEDPKKVNISSLFGSNKLPPDAPKEGAQQLLGANDSQINRFDAFAFTPTLRTSPSHDPFCTKTSEPVDIFAREKKFSAENQTQSSLKDQTKEIEKLNVGTENKTYLNNELVPTITSKAAGGQDLNKIFSFSLIDKNFSQKNEKKITQENVRAVEAFVIPKVAESVNIFTSENKISVEKQTSAFLNPDPKVSHLKSLTITQPAIEERNITLATYVRSEATNQAASKLYNEKKESKPNVTQEPKVLDKYYELRSSRKDNTLPLLVGSSRTSVPTPTVKDTATQVKIEDYTKSLQVAGRFSEDRIEDKKIVHRPQLQTRLPKDGLDGYYYNQGLGLGSPSYNFRYENHYQPQSYTFNNNVVYNLSSTVNHNALQLRGPERNYFSSGFGGRGGCGCKAIQCADRRCGCNKQGISCGSSCLCSSRGSWCLNR